MFVGYNNLQAFTYFCIKLPLSQLVLSKLYYVQVGAHEKTKSFNLLCSWTRMNMIFIFLIKSLHICSVLNIFLRSFHMYVQMCFHSSCLPIQITMDMW